MKSVRLRAQGRPAGGDVAPLCELTILIPCLDEAETIGACVSQAMAFLAESGVAGEVLVSDNGSLDGSQAIAEALGARVIQAPTRGYGGALGDGIRSARGRYVIMGDADDSYDLRHLDAFLAALRAGADLVMGNRFKGGIMPDAMPFLHRYLGNPVLSWIGRLLFGVPVKDFHCGLRGFRRERVLALGLTTTGMEFASEMVVRASLARYAIVEVPTMLRKDGRSRAPHLRTWRDGWRHLRFLLLYSPRWTFIYPGASFLVLGAATSLALVGGPLWIARGVSLGVHTFLVGCILMLVGVQVLTFGMIARRHLEQEGVLPSKPMYRRLMRVISVETWLRMSGVLVLAGLFGFGWAAFTWSRMGFGPLEHGVLLRAMMLSGCAIASGVQLGSSAFLIGILDIGSGDARAPARDLAPPGRVRVVAMSLSRRMLPLWGRWREAPEGMALRAAGCATARVAHRSGRGATPSVRFAASSPRGGAASLATCASAIA